jgi:hypothetical protein
VIAGGAEGASEGPAELDAAAFSVDGTEELQRCAAQHWWAKAIDETGAVMPLVVRWSAVRENLTDRRL